MYICYVPFYSCKRYHKLSIILRNNFHTKQRVVKPTIDLLQQLGPFLPGCYTPEISSKKMRNHPGLMPTNAILYTTLINKRISKAEAKLAYAHKHSLAERERRMRINRQFDNVRSVLPNLIKKDKASVLTEIVQRVRNLKKKVEELKASSHGRILERVLPGDADDLSLVYSENRGLVKATFSCDDRRDLVPDLTRALKSVKGQAVRAEMVVVGGRTKGQVWLKGVGGNEGIRGLRRALQMVVDGPSSSENNKTPNFAH